MAYCLRCIVIFVLHEIISVSFDRFLWFMRNTLSFAGAFDMRTAQRSTSNRTRFMVPFFNFFGRYYASLFDGE